MLRTVSVDRDPKKKREVIKKVRRLAAAAATAVRLITAAVQSVNIGAFGPLMLPVILFLKLGFGGQARWCCMPIQQ